MTESNVTIERLLAAVEQAPPVDSVAVVARFLSEQLDAREVCFLITELGGETLWRLPALWPLRDRKQDPVRVPGTVFDTVIRTQQLHITDAPQSEGHRGGHRVLTPVTLRGDAIGVLELITPDPPSALGQQQIAQAAHALAYVVTANRRFTDLYEWGRRSATPTLAAEIQQNLLPDALTVEAGQATVAGGLEPAGDIAGDTFDYSLDENLLHVSVTDAMGHNEPAALLATLVIGALRQTRRAHASLAEQARAAHQAILDHGNEATVTGQLLRIDLTTGRALLVNAGHPWPMRLRNGRVTEVEPHIDLPFGSPWHGVYRVQEFDLRSGDRLVLFTDGMTERNTAGFDLPAVIERDAHLHPREAVRFMTRALREATGGDLLDDATVVCLDWHGSGSSLRTSEIGADTGSR
ncbi:serine/threonine-protein phosphatase [Streptomyces tubbatahanensis]|uniref:Serine/threonine-protein phosphatase n=1 Tax=Streptomyces tubbatahanensis TaxID=2923272 RepID=A0ABY3Y231_9ACTN|nr:PP2C family protein-serine/threonine phosphatase [Streptomyces tubbatahanensis]UNT00672.1 serine/threonine-protein phosphatase [Streptomyces tubbatahanensis]